MNIKETAVILEIIATMYQNKFRVDDKQLLLDLWHDTLIDYEFTHISENLKAYYKLNKFPPSVAELLNLKPGNNRAIPTAEETRTIMIGWDKSRENAASGEDVRKALAEMQKILGIERG